MAKYWDFETELPGGMDHTLQVQPASEDVDFNLYVYDSDGNLVAEDSRPEAGAVCAVTTARPERCQLKVELLHGSAGFSLNISSRTSVVPEVNKPREAPAAPRGRTALTQSEVDGLLDAHNRWRSTFGVEPMRWSDELAGFAQDWANQLGRQGMKMVHRSPNRYGENLYWAMGKQSLPSEVVDAWGKEVELYDPDLNNWWPKAGHWSQLVWASTTHVGGGVVKLGGQEIWVCNYSPRGNWSGQRPF